MGNADITNAKMGSAQTDNAQTGNVHTITTHMSIAMAVVPICSYIRTYNFPF